MVDGQSPMYGIGDLMNVGDRLVIHRENNMPLKGYIVEVQCDCLGLPWRINAEFAVGDKLGRAIIDRHTLISRPMSQFNQLAI